MIYCSLWKAFCSSLPHTKLCPFFINLAKADVIDVRSGINHLMYETLPKKLFNSLTMDGGFNVAMVDDFTGSTSIPLF